MNGKHSHNVGDALALAKPFLSAREFRAARTTKRARDAASHTAFADAAAAAGHAPALLFDIFSDTGDDVAQCTDVVVQTEIVSDQFAEAVSDVLSVLLMPDAAALQQMREENAMASMLVESSPVGPMAQDGFKEVPLATFAEELIEKGVLKEALVETEAIQEVEQPVQMDNATFAADLQPVTEKNKKPKKKKKKPKHWKKMIIHAENYPIMAMGPPDLLTGDPI